MANDEFKCSECQSIKQAIKRLEDLEPVSGKTLRWLLGTVFAVLLLLAGGIGALSRSSATGVEIDRTFAISLQDIQMSQRDAQKINVELAREVTKLSSAVTVVLGRIDALERIDNRERQK